METQRGLLTKTRAPDGVRRVSPRQSHARRACGTGLWLAGPAGASLARFPTGLKPGEAPASQPPVPSPRPKACGARRGAYGSE